MNCRQVDKYLYDYCDNILNPEQRAQIDQHLIHCPNCRKMVHEALLEGSILREEWHIPALADDFTVHVMNQIACTEVIRFETDRIQPEPRHGKWSRRLIGLTVAAAILFIALCTPGMLNRYQLIRVAEQNTRTNPAKSDDAQKAPMDLPAGIRWSEETDPQNKENEPERTEISLSGVQEESANPDVNSRTQESVVMMSAAPATPEAFPVQPVNLPASYVLLNKVDNAGSSTYTFGEAQGNEQLIINIAQLPLRQPVSSFSRGYTRDMAQVEDTAEIKLQNQNQSSTSSDESEANNEVDADIGKGPTVNTISYEYEFNNDKYLLTITANLSPEELGVLSRDLQLTSTSP